jgi:hypothetical protein
MKLSVNDVARMTGLSISTVRQYSWRMKVGTKEGTRKFFTRDEAKRIGSGNLPKSAGKVKKVKTAKKIPARKAKR